MHWQELVHVAQHAGFCSPVLYEAEKLQYHDETVTDRLPSDIKYKAVTYRLFKRETRDKNDVSTDDDADDVSALMRLTYTGGLKNGADEFWLTASTVLEVSLLTASTVLYILTYYPLSTTTASIVYAQVGDSLVVTKELADTLKASRYGKYLKRESVSQQEKISQVSR